MSQDSDPPPPPGGQFLVYQTGDGKLKIDVRFEGETVWLTQQHMAELFQTTKQNIGQHLKSFFAEGELFQNSVVKESFTTTDGGMLYNHDAVVSGTFEPSFNSRQDLGNANAQVTRNACRFLCTFGVALNHE